MFTCASSYPIPTIYTISKKKILYSKMIVLLMLSAMYLVWKKNNVSICVVASIQKTHLAQVMHIESATEEYGIPKTGDKVHEYCIFIADLAFFQIFSYPHSYLLYYYSIYLKKVPFLFLILMLQHQWHWQSQLLDISGVGVRVVIFGDSKTYDTRHKAN